MVIVHLSGGLGNQLFQYAVGRFLAHKLNTELKLDLSSAKISLNPKDHKHYRLGEFNITENFATPEEIARVKANGIIPPPLPNLENFQRDIYIQGHHFHDEKYFNEIADIIRKELTLKNPLHTNSAAWEKKILAAENSIALHVRHGDYLNGNHIHIAGAIPLAYYRICVAELKKFFPNVTVFVFSDDLNWARENLKLDVPTEFVADCESDNEEFYLMSLCKHIAIANSTFSWWVAWLNPNPDKKVFTPNPQFRSSLWAFGISESWIKIPVDYEDLPVDCPPLLSIVVHVKNQADNLPLMLSKIFNQSFKDFELILIDDGSTDGSELICRQASLNKKVTLIASNSDVGKSKAFTSGLDYARGEYVLFLSGNDLIFSNTVHLLCKMYSLRAADVICSVKQLEENSAGNVTINGLADKKFFQRVDEQFKNLNAPMPFKSGDLFQKLMMIATRTVNASIGTKFFRRDFLIKNSLRFNENIAADCELPFVVNAMMLCDEILFMPNPFYVTLKSFA